MSESTIEAATTLGYKIGLLPAQIESMTVQELVDAFLGYQFRLRNYVKPLALQSFYTSAMFSKEVTFPATLEVFERVCGVYEKD